MFHDKRFLFLISLVLLVGLGLRVWGLRHGAPEEVYHPDVQKLAHMSSDVYAGEFDVQARFGDDHRFSVYPYGVSVINGRVLRLADTLTGQSRDAFTSGRAAKWSWSFSLRCLSIFFWAVSVVAVLCWCRSRLSEIGTWWVGLALAVEPFSVQYSHYGTNDVPLVSALLLAWVASRSIGTERLRFPVYSLLTGLALGLAFGIKYQAVLGGLFLLCVWCEFGLAKRWRPLMVSVGAAGLAGLVGIIFTTPTLWTDPVYFCELFFPFMKWQSQIVAIDVSAPTRIGRNVMENVGFMSPYATVLLLPAIGVPWVLRRSKSALCQSALSASVFALVMLLVLILFRALTRSNDLVVVVPFLIILLGLGVFPKTGGIKARVWSVLAMLLLGWFGLSAVLDNVALSRPDNRQVAQEWLIERVTSGQVVCREHYTLPVVQDGVIDIEYGYAPHGRFKERVLDKTFDYIVLSSFAHGRYVNPYSPWYEKKHVQYLEHIEENYPLLAEFDERGTFIANPVIRIYGPPTE